MKKHLLGTILLTLCASSWCAQDIDVPPPAASPATPPSATTVPEGIDCAYKIPAQTHNIDQALVLAWSEKAALQSFTFAPETVEAQLKSLQSCFTDQGWISFNTALEKSGNLNAIKEQKLNVTGNMDGHSQITQLNNNEWKVVVPLHIIYQNEKEKVQQLLDVQLTVGRKVSGDLGVTQLVAVPRMATINAESPQDQGAPAATTGTPGTSTIPKDQTPPSAPNTGTTPPTTLDTNGPANP